MYPFKVQKSDTFNAFTELGDHRPIHGEHFHRPENKPCALQQLLFPPLAVSGFASLLAVMSNHDLYL